MRTQKHSPKANSYAGIIRIRFQGSELSLRLSRKQHPFEITSHYSPNCNECQGRALRIEEKNNARSRRN